ncbi:DUF2806 domain-containing protein [Pontibacter sp. E15-1]|uniref:DUF2806 domain-containing protein n=1 Tax=Pontibacter sp. E15-1 TaxID=2919918 RepID=UPI001F4F332A|nr:DUF2806 domain-containing protein [Pontibacter sp. E15-1]MCJ8166714.1 DUF2806 domain-containing protein [Pontibacter sp. E15-1]
MKKFLLFAFVSILFVANASAQATIGGPINARVEAACTEITRTMARELHLNELGYIKLKELNRGHLAKIDALVQTYEAQDVKLKEEMEKLELAYEEALTTLLTPKQQEVYFDAKQEFDQAKFVAVVFKK